MRFPRQTMKVVISTELALITKAMDGKPLFHVHPVTSALVFRALYLSVHGLFNLDGREPKNRASFTNVSIP